MSNFISWAIGEIPQESEVEKIQVPEVDESKSFTQTLDKPESIEVKGSVESLRKSVTEESKESVENLEMPKVQSESDSMVTLEKIPTKDSTSIPIEMIKKIDKLESEYNLEKLKFESKESNEDTVYTKFSGLTLDDYDKDSNQVHRLKVQSESSKSVDLEKLHTAVVTELDTYFKENSSVQLLGNDYTEAINSLSKAVESSIQQEPLATGMTYNEYFSNLNSLVENLHAPDSLKSELGDLISKMRSSVIETIKVEYLSKNPNSDLDATDIKNLEVKIQEYPEGAITLLEKYSKDPSVANINLLSANLNKKSSPDSKDFFELYSEYVKPINGGVLELSTSALLGISSLGNINPKVLDGIGHTIDTITSRFGLNNNLRGVNYTVAEFKGYLEVALQILQRSMMGINGGYFPFSAENLVFAATFWMFLEPLKYLILITDSGDFMSLITYANIYKYYGSLKDSPYNTKDLRFLATLLHSGSGFKKLPFVGRDSVKDLEMRNVFDWDIEIEPLAVAGAKPPRMIPYNVDPESKSAEGEHHWLPITSYQFNVSTGVTDNIDLYGVKNLMLPGVKWNLTGSINFFDTSRLWINRWRSEYLKYLYGDEGIGSYLLHPYQQCCYLMTIYLFDSVDHFTLYDRSERFLKKYQLVILPQVGNESYNGDSVEKNKVIEFDVVGILDTSVLKLGEP